MNLLLKVIFEKSYYHETLQQVTALLQWPQLKKLNQILFMLN